MAEPTNGDLHRAVGQQSADIVNLKQNQTALWSDVRTLRSDLDRRMGNKAAFMYLAGIAGTLGALLSQLVVRFL